MKLTPNFYEQDQAERIRRYIIAHTGEKDVPEDALDKACLAYRMGSEGFATSLFLFVVGIATAVFLAMTIWTGVQLYFDMPPMQPPPDSPADWTDLAVLLIVTSGIIIAFVGMLFLHQRKQKKIARSYDVAMAEDSLS